MVQTHPAAVARQTYTVEEMGVLYGVSPASARRLANNDKFPVPRLKLGDRIVFRRADVWADLGLASDPLAPEDRHEG